MPTATVDDDDEVIAALRSGDQAAFAVPYDFRLQLSAPLVRPQALVPSGGWASLAPGTTATDVLRRGVSVHVSATNSQTLAKLSYTDRDSTFTHALGFGVSQTCQNMFE